MAKQPWKPWHEVVKLRDDLRSGELPMHMFAADLYEVLMQRGKRPLYEKPEHFFALTFPTYNLRQLVRDVALRLAGKNDKAVRQLALTYGGGKTHTLITLRHLVADPKNLPDLPSVAEFEQEIGQTPPACRVAGLCFDKLDVEKGMEVRAPDGSVRMLRHPWSLLAYQLAGDEGLQLLHAEGKAEERETAPAENLLSELLALPVKEGLGVLVLLDEVLMYAREKVAQDKTWMDRLLNFFQYLSQAATKSDRCCLVVSLLASDPKMHDTFGRGVDAALQDIFQRQREAVVEPVVKEDVAEVLRRRFFTPESLKDREGFRQHVVAAVKGIAAVDEQMAKQGSEAEDRFLRSFPFHPDLTEVLYSKWTQLSRFQRTRGVLRTFALALREAEGWDTGPLVGPAVFLARPDAEGLSEALRELVSVADTEDVEGRRQSWTGILDNEFQQARRIQSESVGLRHREIEQTVVATFLHSQPVGQTARTRDLMVLVGAVRTDRIELEKGLGRWALGSYWLDDQHTTAPAGQIPGTWRLGNKPNLTQMQAMAAKSISDDLVNSRLLDDIAKTKALTANAAAMGVRVHTLPSRPKDIEDDGAFHYAVLHPNAASDSGKPSAEAKRFLDETTSSDRPRVYRNAILLLAASRDGLELATSRVRDYLAWEVVNDELIKQQKDGNVDPARAQTLRINIDKAKGRIPDAIRQAYSVVVTVSEKDEAQAFKITVTDDPHFLNIKADKRSRVQDTAVTADALLPEGPYNLWRDNETARRVKDLAGAFAQLPHLPKMLKASAILDTLVEGCQQGTFVLRLTRPDGTARTWWRTAPDEVAIKDPALELVLPESIELEELTPGLLAPGRLPKLWSGDSLVLRAVYDYFSGKHVVQVDRGGYEEPMLIPGLTRAAVDTAIQRLVEEGGLWLRSGPASILGEPVPTGVLHEKATIAPPPPMIGAAEILPENLPDAWKEGQATALSIATALSVRADNTLPWKTVRDVVNGALNARFLELAEGSHAWPCDFPSAQLVQLKPSSSISDSGGAGTGCGGIKPKTPKLLTVERELDASQVQDFGDIVPKLLEIKTKSGVPVRFHLRVELGDGKQAPDPETAQQVNAILKTVRDDFELS